MLVGIVVGSRDVEGEPGKSLVKCGAKLGFDPADQAKWPEPT